MKFFSDLRSCYRSGADAAPASMRQEEADAPLSGGGGTVGVAGRRRRSSGGRTRADPGGNWRPALSVISEDQDAALRTAEVKSRERGASPAKRPSPPKRRSAAKRAQSFSDGEDHRPNPLSMFMPAFSPTPFMI
ncbi:BHLH domain-containing protein [Psidium guajava]|nr:BHLH domain-containing protein [Psidium guajava]